MMNGLSAKEVEQLRQRLRDEHAQLRGEVAGELARSEQGRYLTWPARSMTVATRRWRICLRTLRSPPLIGMCIVSA